MVYLKQIREEASAAYTCGAQAVCDIAYDGFHITQVLAYCPMKPEKKEVAVKIMNQAVKDLAVDCDKEMVDKVKTLMLKQFDDMQKLMRQFTGPGASKKMKRLQKQGGIPNMGGMGGKRGFGFGRR